jgi:uncharacterized membrane protein
MLFTAIEIAIGLLFLIVLADAVRQYDRNSKKLLLLVLALIYSLIFENFNMFLSKGQISTYFYNTGFTFYVWNTPLFIALAWAVLIYTAMHISDMLRLKTLAKPFLDALIVVMIDLTLDIVAIRQNIWTWVGQSQTQGWFGVPANNFIGWLFAVFLFSFLFRYFTRTDDDMVNKTTRTEYYFLLPAFAYLGMMVLFSLVNLAEDIMSLTKSEELFVFWALIILFAAMLRKPESYPTVILDSDNYTIFAILLTRLLFYSYIIWSIVLMEIYLEDFVTVIILLMTIVSEMFLYSAAFGKGKKRGEELPHY